MGSAEKFCLRWNDFESNISSAFRELREDKDFFDVTLACDDDQIQAHKVIISACSPFFRSILRRNRHEHPLLYLKGVKYADLVSVLNFMYHGEVNVAQEELNTFLAVAEDLKVKGLTQNSSDSKPFGTRGENNKPTPRKSSEPTDPTPPPKRSRPAPPPSRPVVPTYTQPDDDIQEVVPVKSEPATLPPEPDNRAAQAEQEQPYTAVSHLGQGEQGGGVVEYGEEFGEYEQADWSYDGTGIGVGQDVNKDLDQMIAHAMTRDQVSREWRCNYCPKTHKDKARISRHVEVHFPGYAQQCPYCEKELVSRNSLRNHISDVHTKQQRH
eukprot:GFUD01041658.1.p1 GENE.GFUD01041658.1~~GFUD01041658.1.p1  ORF type:complete len:325 (+),score=77.95 GFUD01041658.1:232-1206(+)